MMARRPRRGKKAAGRRSSFERQIEDQLIQAGINYTYESKKFLYFELHKYTPDFILENGIVIEVKGYFTAADRAKLLRIKELYPNLDLRLVFLRNNKIHPKSGTRYGDWCDKHGFPWALREIPPEWFEELKHEIPPTLRNSSFLKEEFLPKRRKRR